jgi:hypothetical protein
VSRVVTRSGVLLDLADPDPACIRRVDILAGLSGSCRFAGQTDVFYSVAQHSVMVADLVEAFLGEMEDRPRGAILIAALHHDSHEAFMSDLPAPLKELLPEYDRIATRLDQAIHAAIGLHSSVREDGSQSLIHRADMAARCIEALTVIPGAAEIVLDSTDGVSEGDIELARSLWLEPHHPEDARVLFAEREETYHQVLSGEAERARRNWGSEEDLEYPELLRYPLVWFEQEP